MEVHAASSLFRALSGDSLVFIHHGALRDAFSARLIALGEAVVEEAGAPRSLRGKLAFIMVEAFQNLIRHGAPGPDGVPQGTFIMRARPDAHRVITCNAVPEPEVPALVDALDRLREKDAATLKRMFLEGLTSEGRSAKGGAGLGLIEMTRRSGHAIAHALLSGPHGMARVVMRVSMGESPIEPIERETELVELVRDQAIHLVIAGTPGSITLQALLDAVGDQAGGAGEGIPALRTAFLAATQFMEEIGGSAPLVLVFAGTDEGAELIIGTTLEPAPAMALMKEVAHLAAIDPVRLASLYRRSLLGHADDGPPTRLGLIELAYRSRGPLRAFQEPMTKEAVFLGIRMGLDVPR